MSEKNPAFMSEEEREDKCGKVCSYCGYREGHHPVEYSEFYEKDGILCEERQA
jgi:hypothetical protein